LILLLTSYLPCSCNGLSLWVSDQPVTPLHSLFLAVRLDMSFIDHLDNNHFSIISWLPHFFDLQWPFLPLLTFVTFPQCHALDSCMLQRCTAYVCNLLVISSLPGWWWYSSQLLWFIDLCMKFNVNSFSTQALRTLTLY
jgi:hypothetical protein